MLPLPLERRRSHCWWCFQWVEVDPIPDKRNAWKYSEHVEKDGSRCDRSGAYAAVNEVMVDVLKEEEEA